MDWRGLVLVVVLGVCVGLFTGVIENRPSEIGIPEDEYYGSPLAWRITHTDSPDEFRFFELFVDCVVWLLAVAVVYVVVRKLVKG